VGGGRAASELNIEIFRRSASRPVNVMILVIIEVHVLSLGIIPIHFHRSILTSWYCGRIDMYLLKVSPLRREWYGYVSLRRLPCHPLLIIDIDTDSINFIRDEANKPRHIDTPLKK
jgi:hypothetical protein